MMLAQEIHTDDDQQRFLRRAFFGWQCRLRQIAMRQHEGQPQSGMTPIPMLDERFGTAIVTVMIRIPEESHLKELQHIIRRSHDPEKRLKDALKLFSERYYQDPDDFEDTLCAVFQPQSAYAEKLLKADNLRLNFRAYQQEFSLKAQAQKLDQQSTLFAETYWHNLLFNAALPSDCTILAFTPDWSQSSERKITD